MKQIALIIPCFNEANRLVASAFEHLIQQSKVQGISISIFFVNDGSTDDTYSVLQSNFAKNENIHILNLSQNVGKAEAVRQGMMHAYNLHTYETIGFFDADLATPLYTSLNFYTFLKNNPTCKIIYGCRIKRLGATIKRSSLRHYAGRIFATLSFHILPLPIYDSQCGAKLFQKEFIPICFSKPFLGKWLFDIEIILRLLQTHAYNDVLEMVYEYPLKNWTEIAGSKISIKSSFKLLKEMISIYMEYKNIITSAKMDYALYKKTL